MLCAVTTWLSDGCYLARRSHAGAGDGREGSLEVHFFHEKIQMLCITNNGLDAWC